MVRRETFACRPTISFGGLCWSGLFVGLLGVISDVCPGRARVRSTIATSLPVCVSGGYR